MSLYWSPQLYSITIWIILAYSPFWSVTSHSNRVKTDFHQYYFLNSSTSTLPVISSCMHIFLCKSPSCTPSPCSLVELIPLIGGKIVFIDPRYITQPFSLAVVAGSVRDMWPRSVSSFRTFAEISGKEKFSFCWSYSCDDMSLITGKVCLRKM